MDIRNEYGKLLTLDELYDAAKEKIVDELDTMDTDDALYLGNEIRGRNSYDRLYPNNERSVNEVLDNMTPWDVLHSDWEDYSDYFTFDYDFEMTDDVWYDLDTDEIAEDILDGSYHSYITSDIQDILDEYEEAKEQIENYNPYRAMAEEVLTRYINCEADVTDLLQTLDKLVRNDEAWSGK